MPLVGSGGIAYQGAAGAVGTPDVPTGARALLTQADFTYLGAFWVHDAVHGALQISAGQGLALRYVDGQLRFLTTGRQVWPTVAGWQLTEFAAPPDFATMVPQYAATNLWVDPWGGFMGDMTNAHHGLFIDPVTGRFWGTFGYDYPDDEQMAYPVMSVQSTLGPAGAVTAHGWCGIMGHGPREAYGGTMRVPDRIQALYGIPSHVVGFGGYASRMDSLYGPRCGINLFGIPDGVAIGDYNRRYDTGEWKLLAHCGMHSPNDWWHPPSSLPAPTSFDRGRRLPGGYTNWYDDTSTVWPGGGAFPATPPTQWNGPAPGDGYGRWTWGDSMSQNMVWVETLTKHGVIAFPQLHSGNTWYSGPWLDLSEPPDGIKETPFRPGPDNNTLNFDGRFGEFHIYNPDHIGEIGAGTRPYHALSPVEAWVPPDLGPWSAGSNTVYVVNGVAYDPTTQRLWLHEHTAGGTLHSRIHCYQLAAG